MGISEAAIDELRVEISVSLDKFQREIESIKRSVKTAQDQTNSAFSSIKRSVEAAVPAFASLSTAAAAGFGVLGGVLIGKAVTGLIGFGKEALATADSLDETADRLGFTVERFQEVQFAAQQTGQSVGDFSAGMQRFAANIGDAARGQGTFGATLKQLGIALVDQSGALKTNQQIFDEYIAKLGEVREASVRAALAQDAFGRGGSKFLNLVGQLDRLSEQARETAHILTDETVKSLGAANDAIDAVTASIKNELIGVLGRAAIAFRDFNDAAGIRKEAGADEVRKEILGLDKEEASIKERLISLQKELFKEDFEGAKQAAAFEIDRIARARTILQLREAQLNSKSIDDAASKVSSPFVIPKTDEEKRAAKEAEAEAKRLEAQTLQILAAINAGLVRSSKDAVAIASLEFAERSKILDEIQGHAAAVEKARAQSVQIFSNEIIAIQEAEAKKRTKIIDDEIAEIQKGVKEQSDAQAEIAKTQAGEVADLIKATQDQAKAQLEQFQNFAGSIADEIVRNGEISFKGLAKAFEDQLLRVIIQKTITSGLDGLFSSKLGAEGFFPKLASGGGTGSGVASGLLGLGKFFGFFAGGGTIPSGGFGVVGERGPELVRGPASVSPVGGGSPIIQIITDAPGNQVRVKESGGQPNIIQIIHGAVNEGFAKGHYDGAIRGRFRVSPRTVR